MSCACGCGEKKSHEVARRRTADEKQVVLWSDGLVSGAMGFNLKGIGAPRSEFERRKALEAGWLVMGDVELYDYAEVPALVKAARRAVKQNSLDPREFMRRTMKGESFRTHGAVVTSSRPTSEESEQIMDANRQRRTADLKRHMEVCRSLHCRICGTARGGKRRHAKPTKRKTAAKRRRAPTWRELLGS